MNALYIFGFALVSACVAWALFKFLATEHRQFRRLIARHPDVALDQFLEEKDCVVDHDPANFNAYSGPFRLKDPFGQLHKIYIPFDHIDEIEERINQAVVEENSNKAA